MIRVLILCTVVVFLAGCGTPFKRYEFDAKGKITSVTVGTESSIKSVTESLKNKTNLTWGSGTEVEGSLSPGTVENPLPHVKGKIRTGNVGLGTFHKGMTYKQFAGIALVISATKDDVFMGITEKGLSVQTKLSETIIPVKSKSLDDKQKAATVNAKSLSNANGRIPVVDKKIEAHMNPG